MNRSRNTVLGRPIAVAVVLLLALIAGAVGVMRSAAAPGPDATPDLELTMSAAPNPVRAGERLDYTLTVTNPGWVKCARGECWEYGSPVSGVVLAFRIPDGAAVQSVNAGAGFTCSERFRTVRCVNGSLAIDGRATIAIATAAPTWSTTATASATVDPDNAIVERSERNNQASVSVIVTAPLPPPPSAPRAYITHPTLGVVSVVDTGTNKTVAVVPVGRNPWGLAVAAPPADVAASPDGRRVYVTQFNTGSVAVNDTATNTLTAPIAVGGNPTALAVSRNGTRAYVTDWGGGGEGNTVVVVDTASNSVIGRVTVGTGPQDVAIARAPKP